MVLFFKCSWIEQIINSPWIFSDTLYDEFSCPHASAVCGSLLFLSFHCAEIMIHSRTLYKLCNINTCSWSCFEVNVAFFNICRHSWHYLDTPKVHLIVLVFPTDQLEKTLRDIKYSFGSVNRQLSCHERELAHTGWLFSSPFNPGHSRLILQCPTYFTFAHCMLATRLY